MGSETEKHGTRHRAAGRWRSRWALAAWELNWDLKRYENYGMLVAILVLVCFYLLKPRLKAFWPGSTLNDIVGWELWFGMFHVFNLQHKWLQDRQEVWPFLVLSNQGYHGIARAMVGPAIAQGVLISVALIPIFLFLQTLEGFPTSQILASQFLVVTFTVLAASGVPLWMQVSRNSQQVAGLLTYLMLGLLNVPGVTGLGTTLRQVVRGTDWTGFVDAMLDGVTAVAPWTTLGAYHSFDTASRGEIACYQAGLANLIASGMLLFAGGLVFHRRYSLTERKQTLAQRWHLFWAQRRAKWRRRWQCGDGQDALVWKGYQILSGGRSCFIGKALFYGAGLVVAALWPRIAGASVESVAWGTSLVLLACLLLEINWILAHVMFQEIRDKTLESLMLLPVTTRQLVWLLIVGAGKGVIPAAVATGMALAGLGISAILNVTPLSLSWPWLLVIGANVVCQLVLQWHLCLAMSLERKSGESAFILAPLLQWVAGAAIVGSLMLLETWVISLFESVMLDSLRPANWTNTLLMVNLWGLVILALGMSYWLHCRLPAWIDAAATQSSL